MAARMQQRGNGTAMGTSSVEEDGGDSKPSPVTSSALMRSYPYQKVVLEEARFGGIPSSWNALFPM
jgi:hypothetical protein